MRRWVSKEREGPEARLVVCEEVRFREGIRRELWLDVLDSLSGSFGGDMCLGRTSSVRRMAVPRKSSSSSSSLCSYKTLVLVSLVDCLGYKKYCIVSDLLWDKMWFAFAYVDHVCKSCKHTAHFFTVSKPEANSLDPLDSRPRQGQIWSSGLRA